MNLQGKYKDDGTIQGGIEWTRRQRADGTWRRGYTWNPVGGCLHDCQWEMPDGSIAECYAKTVAERLAQKTYPHGFEHHYWRPEKLDAPMKVTEPVRIFIDSMSDLLGHWVPDDQIQAVIDVMNQAHWHEFQLLTKNAWRLLRFDWPPNVWLGVSSPPDFFMGKKLTQKKKDTMLYRSLKVLEELKLETPNITWMSFEPLSWDVSAWVAGADALRWAVIGAASNGAKKYQPDQDHVYWLLEVLEQKNIPVFFKGNLDWSPWREEFPAPAGRKIVMVVGQ